MADSEQIGFVREAIEAALEEAEEVLAQCEKDDPPLFDMQSLSEAAQDFTNLVATQRRRIIALRSFLKEVMSNG